MGDFSYTVRLMTKEDIPEALDIWRSAEQPEGTHCLYTWLEVDKEGFYVAVLDSGEIIGVCCAIIQHPNLAFVGFYVVREKYRGYGVGKKVWDACMEHIGSRNAGVNAVPDKVDLYRDRGGFPVEDTRCACIVNETDKSVNYEALSDQVPDGFNVQPFKESHLPLMFEYDLALIGYDRKLSLELNCKEEDSKTLVAFKDGKCAGFGTIKRGCRNHGHVGPLYADHPSVAEVILRRLIASFPQVQGLVVMTVSSNTAATDCMKRIGCPSIEECPRLYSKEKVEVDTNKVFAHFDPNFSPY